jgi:hypothetical protein
LLVTIKEKDAEREEKKEGRCVGLHNISKKNPNSLKIHPNTHTHTHTPGKFSNMLLENNGEDQSALPSEK